MDTKTELPAAYNLRYVPQRDGNPGWLARHLLGISGARSGAHDGLWPAILRGIDAWIDQAKHYRDRFESGIGEDYLIAPLWYQQGEALQGMLNLDMGPLDCGSLDAVIRETLLAEGWKEE